MNSTRIASSLGLALLLVGVDGCATRRPAMPPVVSISPELAQVDALVKEEKYSEAIEKCIALSRRNPLLPGLAERQALIMRTLTERRAEVAALREAPTAARMANDVKKNENLPDAYETRLPVRGQTNSLHTALSPMDRMMSKKVTVNLDGATLRDFIMALGTAEGVNMVADSETGADKTFSIHAKDVPLQEILDYASRNLGVAFHVGNDMIWATPLGAGEPAVPMETRLYRLRKGAPGAEGAPTNGATADLALIDAIKRFVPHEDNADQFFDRASHVLIVKNTRENLAKVEDLIDALDVTPSQVLIEARFITIAANDLLELGIDWTLLSNWQITDKGVVRNGQMADVTQTRIDKGATIKGVGFADTAAQGLNLTYRGVLTDPTFTAVLHALETSGKSKTLSVPKVATVNNRTASIRLGEDFRYFDEYDVQTTQSGLTAGGATYTTILVPVGKPVLEELGIQLQVTPSVGADLRDINLRIIPDISDFVRYEYYQTAASNGGNNTGNTTNQELSIVKLPIFRRSHIDTEVIVQSGETVVMGGLISSTASTVQEGVPFLSKLPLIGILFRHDKIQEDRQNLLIFVTATLLSNRGENMVSFAPEEPPSRAAGGATTAAAPAPTPAKP